ncbi:hypothetical protein GYMLUDRAFT_237429 [Collybiopsis luxurians FD-317 M1]|nr:hypothetical protein GYMLUDRAFT_237429 [Collybiopsis luxurians FD-317 M1]
MADPISMISFATDMFSLAMTTYKIFRKALAFPESAERLVLRLTVEHVRLQLWGRSSGLDQGQLPPQLQPFEDVIVNLLKRLAMLFEDSVKLREKYGLRPVDELESGPSSSSIRSQRSPSFLRIKEAWKGIVKWDNSAARQGRIAPNPVTSAAQPSPTAKSIPAFKDRLQWAIFSESQFEDLISEIHGYTDSLNNLLRESQQLQISHDWARLQIRMMAGIEDTGSLHLVQATAEGHREYQDLLSMASRKSIVISDAGNSTGQPNLLRTSSTSVTTLRKIDFELPTNFPDDMRCLALSRNLQLSSKLVLIEKKYYPAEIPTEQTELLRTRLKALIRLLNSSDRDSRNLPLCMGYWHEPEAHCWCLVYTISTLSITARPSSVQVRSLLDLLKDSKVRPPLEHRIELASTIAGVLSRLFGSQWLHKSIRSENIAFIGDNKPSITSPLIVGFEYSRQYTELISIDLINLDPAHAMYRHPEYQGNERERKKYRMAYDVYSFGLVLVEIALWKPIEATWNRLEKQPSPIFLEPHAIKLMGEMIKLVERQLAFQMGTGYQNVVLWCLEQARGKKMIEDNEMAAEFYSKVVMPLENMTKSIGIGR